VTASIDLGGASGGQPGDTVGAGLVAILIERAACLPEAVRTRVLARAEVLAAHYRSRSNDGLVAAPAPLASAPASSADGWSELLADRARRRAPRAPRARATKSFIAELRAATATARAAVHVPASAGPYHGAVLAARALEELTALAPEFVSGYVDWLEDLAGLAELLERRATPRK
jgi:hypothetical protein